MVDALFIMSCVFFVFVIGIWVAHTKTAGRTAEEHSQQDDHGFYVWVVILFSGIVTILFLL